MTKKKRGPVKKYQNITIICKFCKQPFTWYNIASWKIQQYCSRKCFLDDVQKSPQEFVCHHCKIVFYRKVKPSRKPPKYCSKKCYHARTRGSNHHCWNGGHSRSYGPHWAIERAAALNRDKHICQDCGSDDKRLDVHHIVPRREFNNDWSAANKLSNLITLCSSCHARLHMQDRDENLNLV